MAQTITGFEETNENLYEIMWGVRLQFCAEILAKVDDIQDALTAFRKADTAYFWGAEGETCVSEADQSVHRIYTGQVKLIPRSPEEANHLFLSGEEASKKQIDIIVNQINGDTDVIVELGAGYGGNLIRLDKVLSEKTGKSLSENHIRVIMAEYTNSGRSLCAEFLKCKNAPQMELHHIDHKAPDLSFLDGAENPLIMTIHSIEQVQEIPLDYFKKLASAGRCVRGLHLEPVGFQFEPDDLKWKKHAEFIEKQGYNQNFASVIKQAEKDGYIIIDSVDTEFAAGQPENPSTLVTWHSNN